MRPLTLLAIALALVLGSGCSKRAPEKGGEHAATRLPDVLSYDEPTVGRSDTLVNAIGPALAPWMVLWRHAYSGFQSDSLIRIGVEPAFRNADVGPLKSVYPPPAESAAAFRILSARSPDRRYDLIFDGYQCVEEVNGEIDIGGDADSAPLLLDLKRQTSTRFEVCGPGNCPFHWGAWVSPTRFILAGTLADEKTMGVRGRVQVISISDSTVTTYVTRPVHSSRGAIYQSAWEGWVAMRYHATNRVASRS